MRGQKGGIITRVDPPAADVMLVELEFIRKDVGIVVPEVVVVLGRAEDPLFVGGWGVVRVRDLGDRVRFDWEPCDTTAQSTIDSPLSLGQICIHSTRDCPRTKSYTRCALGPAPISFSVQGWARPA